MGVAAPRAPLLKFVEITTGHRHAEIGGGGVNSHFLQKPLTSLCIGGCQRLCPVRVRSVTSDLAAVISMIFSSPGSSKLPCKTIAFAL